MRDRVEVRPVSSSVSTVASAVAWLVLLVICAPRVGAAEAAASEGRPLRPNIVFLYVDDMGYGDLGCYGNADARTPNLDRLAREGTRFTQFYVSHCVCSPTRASFITGQFPSRARVFGHFAHLEANAKRGMPDWLAGDGPSLPRVLQSAGYRTALFGKWHLGGGSGRVFQGKPINSPNAPPVASYGFDADRTIFGNGPTWRDGQPVDAPHDVYPYEDESVAAQSSAFIVDAAIGFLAEHARDHRDGPFLLNVWFHVPHVPMKPTDAMREPFRHLPEPQQTFHASVSDLDGHVGRLLAKLDETGVAEDTLVLFASDNGGPWNNGATNKPLRDGKHQLYEGGIRVPFIARWPGRVRAGRTDGTSVLNIVDFTPTLSRLAGAAMPNGYEPDGVDATAALFGADLARAKPMFWHHPTAQNDGPKVAMREGDWKLTTDAEGNRPALFDLAADPSEANDVALQRPAVVEGMRARLLDWMKSLPPPLHAEKAEATGVEAESLTRRLR